MTTTAHHPGRRSGFTLVELMVAIAVLVLIMALLAQVFNVSVQATSVAERQIEATRQARQVLDTLRQDLANIVTGNNAATVFIKDDGQNTQLVFVTQRRAPLGSTERYLAITYTFDKTQRQVERSYALVPWTTADLVTAAFTTPTTPAQAIATGALRFQAAALLDTGDIAPLNTTGASWMTTTWNGTSIPQGFSALKLAGTKTTPDPSNPKVRGIAVAVATLDARSLLLPNIDAISTALSTAATGQTPLEGWTTAINGGALAATPRTAAAALRLLQLTYPLP